MAAYLDAHRASCGLARACPLSPRPYKRHVPLEPGALKKGATPMPIRSFIRSLTRSWLVSAVLVTPALAQNGPISGTVVDSHSQPIGDARVVVEGTTLQTQTNSSGQFRLGDVRGPEATLRVTRIGYTPLVERVAVGSSAVRFVLADAAIQLN